MDEAPKVSEIDRSLLSPDIINATNLLRGLATHAQKRAYEMGKTIEKELPPDPSSKRRTGKRQANRNYQTKLKRQSHFFMKAADIIERNAIKGTPNE